MMVSIWNVAFLLRFDVGYTSEKNIILFMYYGMNPTFRMFSLEGIEEIFK